ncbi:hypothetical protein C0Z01_04975 [Photobacterium kishitanii]|uniref:Uncharacterized protein n=1 Tax=Photobacterium kishitanii TaxID=318456 RepID=A0A2T3QRC3_9GAMM|nr:hypothetical protein [Photobacterium kishitanii]KJG07650.1 hypothetical protein UB40_19120 [Photobacterium kishitanii]KJG60839.1 hypothetical protein UA42_12965 [Photobacterium kishitanii]KJG65114.1 hypothetical protein UA40_12845 [Photobacterium kishitanii]KJG69261.1 hypothetical protein UA41_12060 [Photobacterium kishitanii]OBU23919.1 hypothetical protein AYY22_06210 [Photobacterium kishitanii]
MKPTVIIEPHQRRCYVDGSTTALESMLLALNANQYIISATIKAAHKLRVKYDFRYIEFQQVLAIIAIAGVDYKDGFFQHLKYQLYTDADLQARDNLNITPFCCDKVAIRRENL